MATPRIIISEVTFPRKDQLTNQTEPVPTEVSQPTREVEVSPRGRPSEKLEPRGREDLAEGRTGGRGRSLEAGPAGGRGTQGRQPLRKAWGALGKVRWLEGSINQKSQGAGPQRPRRSGGSFERATARILGIDLCDRTLPNEHS